jgi:hypothetical protein
MALVLVQTTNPTIKTERMTRPMNALLCCLE